jgi:hypothetical protein
MAAVLAACLTSPESRPCPTWFGRGSATERRCSWGRRAAGVERMTLQRMEHVGIVVDDLADSRRVPGAARARVDRRLGSPSGLASAPTAAHPIKRPGRFPQRAPDDLVLRSPREPKDPLARPPAPPARTKGASLQAASRLAPRHRSRRPNNPVYGFRSGRAGEARPARCDTPAYDSDCSSRGSRRGRSCRSSVSSASVLTIETLVPVAVRQRRRRPTSR